jgi:phosphoglucosamine mutase
MATIAVTASHNPASDNGWKGMLGSYKPDGGQARAISDRAWDMYSASRKKTPDFSNTTRNSSFGQESTKRLYKDQLVFRIQEVFGEQPLTGKILVYDGANGAGSQVTPDVLSSLGAEVRMINCGEGIINDSCGAAQEGLTSLMQAIAASRLSSNPNFLGGIANDGDADRLMAVGVAERNGEKELVEVDGNHIMYELAQNEPGIVGTIYTNSGLRTKLAEEGVAFEECGNGDQYVTQALKKRAGHGWRRGGEFSGLLIDMDWLNSGDGVAMAAWLSAALAREGSNFGDLYHRVPLWHESMKKLELPKGTELDSKDPRFAEAQEWAGQQMAGEGRSIVRPSGTEPVVRVWVESPHLSLPTRIGEMLHTKLYRELVA